MVNRTVTANSTSYNGTIAGIKFSDGVATADDTTEAGRRLLAFAKRRGWKYTSAAGTVQAVPVLVREGKPVARWTDDELREYLTAQAVTFPENASHVDLLNAVHTAFETRAQGGAAALEAAGHTQGTFPVLGAPDVRGDDASKTAVWEVPVLGAGGTTGAAAARITTQPSDVAASNPAADVTFTAAAGGVAEPTFQWQKFSGRSYVDIAGATDATLTVKAADVKVGDRYRAVAKNQAGDDTTNPAEILPVAV